MMYSKDKTETLHIRMSKAEMEYLNRIAETMGMSKSDIIRGYIDRLAGAKAIYEHMQAN